ncbi:MAG: ferritin-like fold-containing protein [Micrococcales bacterium]
MFEWIKGLRKRAPKLVLPSREERAAREKGTVDLRPFAPEVKDFLGQLAYLQLSSFEIMTAELKFAPTTLAKTQLSEASAKNFEKYRQLSRKLSALSLDPTDAMDPFVERIDTFHSRTTGLDWYENVLKIYLAVGFLDDFYRRLAVGLPADLRADIEKILNDRTIERFVKQVLVPAMAEDQQLGSRLSLWGRRIMGDVILELRAAVPTAEYVQIEALVTELIAAHSLRMDGLGLAA